MNIVRVASHCPKNNLDLRISHAARADARLTMHYAALKLHISGPEIRHLYICTFVPTIPPRNLVFSLQSSL